MGQGPGPGPLGPGAWGPLGPRCRIRVESVTTYCQASYLLSGKLPTIRQAISRIRDAPKRHILCTQTSPYTLHPTSAYFAPKRFRIHAPKFRIHAPKRFRIQTTCCQAKLPTVRQAFSRYETCTQQPHTCTQPIHRHAPKRRILCTQK